MPHPIGAKIRKIKKEGIRGKRVPQKQAVAVALNMARRGKLGKLARRLAPEERK